MMGIALNVTFKSFSFWSFRRNTASISLWKKVVSRIEVFITAEISFYIDYPFSLGELPSLIRWHWHYNSSATKFRHGTVVLQHLKRQVQGNLFQKGIFIFSLLSAYAFVSCCQKEKRKADNPRLFFFANLACIVLIEMRVNINVHNTLFSKGKDHS